MLCHEQMRAVALVTALVLTPVCVGAQSTETASPPRTAWGAPDLGGIFDYSSITPMQRPEKFSDQEYLTEEQAAALEQGAVDRDTAAAEAPVTRSFAGDTAGANSHSWV